MAVIITFVALVSTGHLPQRHHSSTAAMLGGCSTVSVLGGADPQTPFSLAAQDMTSKIHRAYGGTATTPKPSDGSVGSLRDISNTSSKCTVALAQLDETVSARYGIGPFDCTTPQPQTPQPQTPQPHECARANGEALQVVGPVFMNVAQLLVSGESRITTAAQLCGSTPVAAGVTTSGEWPLWQVVAHSIQHQATLTTDGRQPDATCTLQPGADPTNPLNALKSLDVADKPVFWIGAPSTREIHKQAATRLGGLRLVALDAPVVEPGTDPWTVQGFWALNTSRYPTGFSEKALQDISADVYPTLTISATNKVGTGATRTFGTPALIVSNKNTDSALVSFLANWLITNQNQMGMIPKLQGKVDGLDQGLLPTLKKDVYCLVPLDDDASKEFRKDGQFKVPSCPSTPSPSASSQ
ncbi:hypothetical protein [Frankia sp. AiPa1]|uniref:hypothetical protein n=1 Tax=Frankia sp. AiPa1 TaxID=573492 RepID=UPI00202B0CF7|nr:hypothetical protein [Frankia sp. AiPa1]MCL9759580.1 hypothetical protein [Frankia sp. AiPa1]